MNLQKCYIDTINDKNNKIVQLILLRHNCRTDSLSQVMNFSRFLYISETLRIEHNRSLVEFKPYSDYKEILLEDIFKL